MQQDLLFDEIRPYRDFEIPEVIKNVLQVPEVAKLVQSVFPGVSFNDIKNKFQQINSVDKFQEEIVFQVMSFILSKTSEDFVVKGREHLAGVGPFLFISNHRDIVLDPALLNYTLVIQNYKTAEVAIGDNLLSTPWIKDLARLNKSFVVKRSLSPRELVKSSRVLSEYIKDSLLERKHSIWIAQREGRAKDGDDRTQPGLINMIGMAGSGHLKEYFASLNIIPVSISYEHDPCDADKVKAIYNERHCGGHVKEQHEDNLSMQKGIIGDKGKINLSLGKSLTNEILALPDGLHKNEFIEQLCKLLDREIIGNFQTTKSNFIAFDHRFNSKEFMEHYTPEDKQALADDIEQKISLIKGDQDVLRDIFYEKYSRPILNKKELGMLIA